MEGFKNIFEFWILFPLGGIALLSVKKWSYPLFVGVQLYSIYSHIFYQEFTWPYVSKSPFFSSLALIAFNIAMIVYFSLPNVRKPFFDRRMRLWETKPRYGTEIPCSVVITAAEGEVETIILNISQTGAFVEAKPQMQMEDKVKLTFHHHDFDFSLNGSIVNKHTSNGIDGYGIEFHFSDFQESWMMRRFIRKIKKSFKNSYNYKEAA